MNKPSVSVRNLTKSFSGRRVVDGLSTKSMNVATSLLYFPMLLFFGATIPAEVFPADSEPLPGGCPLAWESDC